MGSPWVELDMDVYKKLLAECKTDVEFRRRVKELTNETAKNPKPTVGKDP